MQTQTTTHGFTKTDRLLTAGEFQRVFAAPIKKIHTAHLLAFIAKNDGDTARLGLAITKKKLKKAVDRNRIKRLTREQFRQSKTNLAGIDMVVIVKVGYDRAFDITPEVAEMFSKINKLYGK
ncbi:ribonuclease P protein component [Moraxella marmotae]|uniref:ribonuclease P protein component n=1 Tax=Moraxella marmotae TaxID=3344520 RepID=UPI0035F4A984